MDKLLELISQLMRDFSWRRLLTSLVLLLLLLLGIAAYEHLTYRFRLERIQKTTDVLSKLRALETSLGTNDTNLIAVYRRLALDLKRSSDADLAVPNIALKMAPFAYRDALWPFVAGAALWLALGLMALWDGLRGNSDAILALPQTAVLGGISGLAAVFFPRSWPDYVRYLVAPLVEFVAIILLLWLLSSVIGRYRAAKNRANAAKDTLVPSASGRIT